MTQTPFIFRPEDEDKKIYVVKQEYIMTVEQYIKADNEEDAFNIFLTDGDRRASCRERVYVLV